jgi:cell division protein FtsB
MRWVRWVVALAILVLSAGVVMHTLLDADGWTRREKVGGDLEAARAENARLESENESLRSEIRSLRDRPEVQERVVRDELGYVRPGELVLELGDDANARR